MIRGRGEAVAKFVAKKKPRRVNCSLPRCSEWVIRIPAAQWPLPVRGLWVVLDLPLLGPVRGVGGFEISGPEPVCGLVGGFASAPCNTGALRNGPLSVPGLTGLADTARRSFAVESR